MTLQERIDELLDQEYKLLELIEQLAALRKYLETVQEQPE